MKFSASHPHALARVRSLPATRRFLLFLTAFSLHDDVLPRSLILKSAWQSWPDAYLAELEQEFRDRSAAKLLWQIKKSRLIKTRRVADRVRCVLTEKGLDTVMRDHMSIAPKLLEGKVLIVSFDIPEQQRSARDALRTFLRGCGFVRWHDSLWIIDKDIRPLLEHSLGRMRAGRWVTLYEAQKLKPDANKT